MSWEEGEGLSGLDQTNPLCLCPSRPGETVLCVWRTRASGAQEGPLDCRAHRPPPTLGVITTSLLPFQELLLEDHGLQSPAPFSGEARAGRGHGAGSGPGGPPPHVQPRPPPHVPAQTRPRQLGPAHPWPSAATWWRGAGVPLGAWSGRRGRLPRGMRMSEFSGGTPVGRGFALQAQLLILGWGGGSLPGASLPAQRAHLCCTWRAEGGWAPAEHPSLDGWGDRPCAPLGFC